MKGYKSSVIATYAICMTFRAAVAAPVSAGTGTVVFVDADAPGQVHDGLSWATAFADVQDALDQAAGGTVNEIWVASGSYRPSKRTEPGDPRTATFQLLSGVGLYGGFFGNETARDQRRPDLLETILTGDLAGDDGPALFANNDENSYHVVTGSSTDATAVLDGFVIQGGNADENSLVHDRGAGMYNSGANPTVANCTFRENAARFLGGGMYNLNSSPTLRDCAFTRNSAIDNGGGMYNEDANPELLNCLFLGNLSSDSGGGMGNLRSDATLVNCVFAGNWSFGAFDGCTGFGGGMYNNASNPTLTNCTFSRNQGASWCEGGAAVFNSPGSAPVLTNCILWGNTMNKFPTPVASTEEIQIRGGSPVINYTCVEGLSGALAGVGNIGDDPLFINPQGFYATVIANVRFRAGSPCIDAGNNGADTDANTAGVQPLPTFDPDGNSRFLDDPVTVDSGIGAPPIVDMGAYEFVLVDCNGNGLPDGQDIADKTSADVNQNGIPDECECVLGIYGDVDHNGTVNLFDLFCILDGFAGDFSVCSPADVDVEPCDGNGTINIFDLFAVLNAFAGDPLCPKCP